LSFPSGKSYGVLITRTIQQPGISAKCINGSEFSHPDCDFYSPSSFTNYNEVNLPMVTQYG
ncbi:hypothetical protein CS542_08475, partial [Pedobacter sp. IW39]